MKKTLVFFGDIVGRPGRNAVKAHLAEIRKEFSPDLVIANGENAAGGVGLDPGTANELYAAGIDFLTSGNHIWNRKEFYSFLDERRTKVIRPLNYPVGAPGAGFAQIDVGDGVTLAIVNLMGRVFTGELVDCPFKAVDTLLNNELSQAKLVLVDFHAEATSEKIALGWFLDGRVSCVLGTHTHVQTADERVLPKGTAYISDVGMCGPWDSVIGMGSDDVVKRFITGLPHRFDVAKGRTIINAIVLECDTETGHAISIKRINFEA